MPYDFFSNAHQTGPQIDTDLFARAAQQGAETGKEIGTPLSSAVTGFLGGVKEGLSDVNSFQANEIQGQTLQQQQIKTQENALELQLDQDTQNAKEQATLAQLKQQTGVASQASTDLQNKNEISGILASGDPTAIKGIYSNPSYTQTLLGDHAFADSVLGQAQPALDQATFAKAYQGLGYSKALAYNQELAKLNGAAQANLFGLTKDAQTLPSSFSQATSQVKTPQDADRLFSDQGIQVFQKGTVNADSAGNLLKNSDGTLLTKQLSPTDQTALASDTTPYDVYNNGKYVNSVSKGDADSFFKTKANYNYQKAQLGASIYGGAFNGTPGLPGILGIQGIGIQPPQPQPTATPVAGGNLGLGTSAVPSATPTPTPTAYPDTQNAAIVQQTQQQFQKLAANPPPGIQPGTLDQQYQKKLGYIHSMIDAQRGVNAVATAGAPPPAASLPTAAPQTPQPPQQNLSAAFKQNVDFTFDVPTNRRGNPVTLDQGTFDAINTNPLTANTPALFKGLVAQESGGNANALSNTGVQGLAQVTKSTAAIYGLNRDIPEQNVLAGQLYLTDLLTKFNGNLPLALAAYSAAGPGGVSDAVRATGSTDWPTVKAQLQQTLAPKVFKQVENYPEKVLTYAAQFMGPNDQGLAYELQRQGLVKLTDV